MKYDYNYPTLNFTQGYHLHVTLHAEGQSIEDYAGLADKLFPALAAESVILIYARPTASGLEAIIDLQLTPLTFSQSYALLDKVLA